MASSPATDHHPGLARPEPADYPTITHNVAMLFGAFGILASIGMGWVLARSTAGLPPFQIGGPAATRPAATAAELRVVATDLKFDAREYALAGPGQFKVKFDNQGGIEHDFTIEGVRGKVYAAPKKTAEGTFTIAKPGTYTVFCSVPGHREAGMVGRLLVGEGSVASAPTTRTDSPAPAAHVSHATTVSTQQRGNQELQPVLDGAVKVFNLTARAVKWEVLPGVLEEAWTYNDQLPGPIIRVTEGDRIRVSLKNELPEETVLHFHGPRIPNAQDGVPDVTQPTIKVGDTYTYEFTAEPAGTYVYHSHHNSAVQEPKGLYGVFIIDPKPGSALAQRDAQHTQDVVQVLSEFEGHFVINGKAFPATEVIKAKAGEKVRIRLVNLGQASHPMHLHGFHFSVIGTDGRPVQGPPLEKDTLNIAPGERYDLEFVADNPGTWVFHCHILSHVANRGVEPGGMITVISVT